MSFFNEVDARAIGEILRIVGLRKTIGLITLLIIGSIASVAAPVFFGFLVDGLTDGQLSQPIILFCLYAVLAGSNRLISDFRSTLIRLMENEVVYEVGIKFFRELLRKPLTLFDHQSGSSMLEIIRHLQQSIRIYINLFFSTLLPSLSEIIAAVVFVGVIINFQIGILVLIYGAAIIIVTYRSNQRVQSVQRMALVSLRENAFFLGDACGAIRSIKLTNSESWIGAKYDKVNDNIRKHWFSFHKTRLGYSLIRSTFFIVQLAILFVISLYLYNSGQISIGELVLFNGIIIQLNRPAELIAMSIEEVLGGRQLREGYEEVQKYENIENSPVATQRKEFGENVEIEFINVKFSYGGEDIVLNDFTKVFKRGAINFIVGKSGNGKSTLMNMLMAFIGGYEGKILIGGRDHKSIPTDQLYKLIAYVPQSVELLNASLADNIKMGADYPDSQLERAISKAGLTDRVASLDDGIHSLLGRNGIRLSGGEQQRVSIARALIREPSVLLLDEPSSALDGETENAVFTELRREVDSMLIIAVTHRTSVIGPYDIVIDMNVEQHKSA